MSLLSPPLVAFMAVVHRGTVHGAAADVHLTQTAVTQRIRTLEAMLKTTLFIRTRRGMKLTHQGEALLRYCQAAKELEGEALASIQGAGILTEVELTITSPSSMMRSRVIPGCLSIMKSFPNLLLHFEVNDKEVRHQILRSGQVDFSIIREENVAPEMQSKKLLPEQYVLVCSSQWKSRRMKDIIANERIIDFDSSDQITLEYLKAYDLFSLAQRGRYYINQTENLADLVISGVGYSVLAKEFAEPYIKSKQLMVLNKSCTYDVYHVLAWFDRPEPPRYFSAIIDAIA